MESKYTAIIIEPRKHKALEFVLNNFLENLNDDWNIIIYHGNNNIDYLQNIIDNKLNKYKNRITSKNLNVDNLSINDYNNIMKNREFIDSIPTEMFLIFQTDTMICEEHKELIYNYMNYDYVGAPWSSDYLSLGNDIDMNKLSLSSTKYVGNGGLSLRRKSKMIEILDKCTNYVNEDVYFSYGCKEVDIKKPLIEDAKNFSIEQIENDKSFGIHKAWAYVNVSENQCKNYNELVKLNTIQKNSDIQENFDIQEIKKNTKSKKYIILTIILIIIIVLYIIKINKRKE